MPVVGQARAARRELAHGAPARALRRPTRRAAASSPPKPPACATTTRASASARSPCACSPTSPASEASPSGARRSLPAARSTPRKIAPPGTRRLRAGDGAPQEVKDTLGRMKQLVSTIREQKKFTASSISAPAAPTSGPRLVADALERRRAGRPLRRQRRSARPGARARRRRAGQDAVRGGLEDLHHAGNDGERRARAPVGRQGHRCDHREHRSRQGVRRERRPADVGLGRRALLGVVGGGLFRGLCHRLAGFRKLPRSGREM